MPYLKQFSWSAPTSIPAMSSAAPWDSPRLANNGDVTLAVCSTGMLMYHWLSVAVTDSSGVWTVIGQQVGDTNGNPLNVTQTPSVLALDDDTFYLIWKEYLTLNMVSSICTVTRNPNTLVLSATFSPPVVVPNVAAVDSPGIAGDGTTAHMVWCDRTTQRFFYAWADMTRPTINWSAGVMLNGAFTAPRSPVLACANGSVLMAFAGFSPQQRGGAIMYVAEMGPTNGDWTRTFTLIDAAGVIMTGYGTPDLCGMASLGFSINLAADAGGNTLVSIQGDGPQNWNNFQTTNFKMWAWSGSGSGSTYVDGEVLTLYKQYDGNNLWFTAALQPYAKGTGATWMSALVQKSPAFAAKGLAQVAMIGSHDAGMYRCFPQIADWWAATQSLTMLGQLNAGSRYFDLRIGVYTNLLGQSFYETYHGNGGLVAWGATLPSILADVVTFLGTAGNNEVIILKFSHPLTLSQLQIDTVANTVQSTLAAHLWTAPFTGRLADIPLRTLTTNGTRGVVLPVFDLDMAPSKQIPGIYSYADSTNPGASNADLTVFDQYSNTNVASTMINDQRTKLNTWTRKCTDGVTPCDLFLLSWTLTQQSMFNTAVYYMAQSIDPSFVSTYQSWLPFTPNRANVWYFDYLEFANALDFCIQANS